MRGFGLLVAMAVLIQNCSCSLIVGGDESVPNSRPYQVAIMGKSKSQFCGGTLVHESWVISAAHCVAFGSVYVGLGYHLKKTHDKPGQQFIQATWTKHPNYDQYNSDNDIAFLHLDTPATLNDKVQTIKISSSQPSVGTDLLVSGWGRTHEGATETSNELREVVVKALSSSKCKNDYSGAITDNMFCAGVSGGGKDACHGDSGGPIVSHFGQGVHDADTTLEGISSWGIGCASAQYPGVYTKISNYCTWMSKITAGQVSC